MSALNVQIVKLDKMRVASVLGFGPSPEEEAWKQLDAWAKSKGFRDKPEQHPIFGFNNPDPSPGSPNYGYELWMKVGSAVEPEGNVRVQDFAGGLYAVARCEVPKGNFDVIGKTWQQLVTWREDSKYKSGQHQWLEKSVAFDASVLEFALDLYIPIAK
ncbi:MAG: AraC family transcriptional regulator [Chloroflexi bacterium]|nr:MAG: AraC family transcriptional regulator [Chloroflexota bacterium]